MKRVPAGKPEGGQFAPEVISPPPLARIDARALHDEVSARQEEDSVGNAFRAFRNHHPLGSPIPPLPADGEAVRVIFVRGIPASGKSTWARAVQEHYPPGSVVRINNDELAASLFGGDSHGASGAAKVLDSVRKAALASAIKLPETRLVIMDNTNVILRAMRPLVNAAWSHGAEVEVNDDFLKVSLETCLERNAARETPVPESVVRRMHKQASNLKEWAESPPAVVEPYHNDPSLPPVVLVDIDGTLATMHPDRSPYDFSQVGQDLPNASVVNVIRALRAEGAHVIVMSGRDASCREETQAWLERHVGKDLPLHMRPEGDVRPDNIIKLELFQQHVADQYHVSCVFDDRDQVVNLWRRQLKLPTFQVADGDF